MADISLTSASIRPGSNAIMRDYDAGGSVTVGYAGYIASDGDVEHADANLSEAASRGIGVIVETHDGETTASSGDRINLVMLGEVHGFSGMTPGAPVYVSKTAGRLDHTKPTSAYQWAIGVAISTTCLFVNPQAEDPTSA